MGGKLFNYFMYFMYFINMYFSEIIYAVEVW